MGGEKAEFKTANPRREETGNQSHVRGAGKETKHATGTLRINKRKERKVTHNDAAVRS